MAVEKDYEDFIKLLNRHKVRYCIVGAFAVAYYGRPRYTKDMDVLVEANRANGQRIVKALERFGFARMGLQSDDFTRPHRVIQLGYEPVRIDLLTSIPGCRFQQVWLHRELGHYGKEKAFFIGLGELIKNKKASKRKQDKVDLDMLIPLKKKT